MNEDQDRIDRLVQSVLAVNPSTEFESRIRQRVRRESRTHKSSKPLLLVAGFAAVVVVILAGAGLPRHETHPMHAPSASSASSVELVSNAPAIAQPSPVALSEPSIATTGPLLATVGDPPVSSLSTEALAPPPLEEFSLGTSSQPLITAALPQDNNLPQFAIQSFSLLGSNEGVAE
jgi:hypothetical protein